MPGYTTSRWSNGAPTTSRACCVVGARLAERLRTVMGRGMPYVICDTDGTPVTPEQAKHIIAERWTVTEDVRRRRRSKEQGGEDPSPSPHGA